MGTTMGRYESIYRDSAAEYHRMISAEDVDNHLIPALRHVMEFDGKKVLDIGSGTGRIPILLKGIAPNVVAFDLSRAMLAEQAYQRDQIGGNWSLIQGDMRALPFIRNSFEIIFTGWAIGHFCSWFEEEWKTQIGVVLQEMHRVATPGGGLIILETMTTGSVTPSPPTNRLQKYYEWLEQEWGFQKQIVRTDYQFEHSEQAIEHTEFFFGSELAKKIRENEWSRIPEWSGIWSKKV